MTRRINAEDVARLAGVSKTTVSRAFALDSSISPDKKRRVTEAAKKLGYRPNALARSLRTTRSNLIGVILREFTNPLILQILEFVTHHLQEKGLHAVTINAANDIGLSEAMELVLQYRIDGLVVFSDIPLKIEYECAAMSLPLIVFGRSDKRIPGTFGICMDDENAGRLAARHLIDQGYRKPAFVGCFRDVSVTLDRRNGFASGLAELGMPSPAVEYAGGNTYDDGYSAARRLLAQPDVPDAVFCESDQLATGFIDAAKSEFGLDIPYELGVLGVDDNWMSKTIQYDLTTIAQPLEDMAEATVRLMLAKHQKADDLPPLFQGALVPRGSTRRTDERTETSTASGRLRASQKAEPM